MFLTPEIDCSLFSGWGGWFYRGQQLRQDWAVFVFLLPARHIKSRHHPLLRTFSFGAWKPKFRPFRPSVCTICIYKFSIFALNVFSNIWNKKKCRNFSIHETFTCSVLMPETGSDCRKKTTVKWASTDPEFNEQVMLVVKRFFRTTFKYFFSVCVYDEHCGLA